MWSFPTKNQKNESFPQNIAHENNFSRFSHHNFFKSQYDLFSIISSSSFLKMHKFMKYSIKKLSQSINQMHSFIYIHKCTSDQCTPFACCIYFCSWKSFCAHLILISAISSMFVYINLFFYSAVCHELLSLLLAVANVVFTIHSRF